VRIIKSDASDVTMAEHLLLHVLERIAELEKLFRVVAL
jgi:hypothetical protein